MSKETRSEVLVLGLWAAVFVVGSMERIGHEDETGDPVCGSDAGPEPVGVRFLYE